MLTSYILICQIPLKGKIVGGGASFAKGKANDWRGIFRRNEDEL